MDRQIEKGDRQLDSGTDERLEIVGRTTELDLIASVVERVPKRTQTLLLEGEAGVGKTTLWRAGLRVVPASWAVLQAIPVQAEATLAYGALADLFEPVVDTFMSALPAPQQLALNVALLRSTPHGATPDARAVGSALLGGLRELSATDPVLVAIDDVQWLDRASQDALSFAARRLSDERVLFLLARRSGANDSAALPVAGAITRIEVERLGERTLARLLGLHVGHRLSRSALDRLYQASAGNPFYALELANALERRGADLAEGEPLEIPATLRLAVTVRLEVLSPTEHDVLLAAALLTEPTTPLVEAAMGDMTAPALRSAVTAGLVTLDGPRVRFVHPLFASILAADARATQVREIHKRLADVVDEPEQRGRHLALATDAPDERVAEVVQQGALHAAKQGAPTAAADLYELAAELSETADSKNVRLVAAAHHRVVAAEPQRADELLARLLELLEPGPIRTNALLVQATANLHNIERLLQLVAELLGDATGGTAPRVSALAMRAMARGVLLLEPSIAIEDAREAVAGAEEVGDPLLLGSALSARAWIETLLGQPPTEIADVAALEEQRPFFRADRPMLARLVWRGDLDVARPWFTELREQARDNGDEESAAAMALHLCELELRSGDWQAASQYAEETAEYARFAPSVEAAAEYLAAAVCAHQGDLAGARRHANHGIAVAQRPGLLLFELLSRVALGATELSAGNASTAASILEPLFELVVERGLDEPGEFPFVPDLIEALVGTGRPRSAETPLAWLEKRAREQDHPWGQAVAARCRGLVLAGNGDAETAATALQLSISRLEQLPLPFELVRSRLSYGVVLRRNRRRSAARTQLAEAVDGFDRLGARAWGERAREELGRISGRAPAPNDLTAAQRRVAERAARGLSNREIAAELFITVNTVESHLKQVFAKLGVRSRTELGRRL